MGKPITIFSTMCKGWHVEAGLDVSDETRYFVDEYYMDSVGLFTYTIFRPCLLNDVEQVLDVDMLSSEFVHDELLARLGGNKDYKP